MKNLAIVLLLIGLISCSKIQQIDPTPIVLTKHDSAWVFKSYQSVTKPENEIEYNKTGKCTLLDVYITQSDLDADSIGHISIVNSCTLVADAVLLNRAIATNSIEFETMKQTTGSIYYQWDSPKHQIMRLVRTIGSAGFGMNYTVTKSVVNGIKTMEWSAVDGKGKLITWQ